MISLVKKFLKLAIVLSILCFVTLTTYAATVICGGGSVGIALSYEGVLITGTYDYAVDTLTVNPVNNDIHPGDLITQINGNKVENISILANEIQSAIEANKEVTLSITRNNESLQRTLNVNYDQATGTFKTGLYVKDSTIGIGTMTYYDPQNHTFASLGHSLSDQDFNLEFANGTVFDSYVKDVVKNNSSKTGEKIAVIEDQEILGQVIYNNEIGVYGYYYGTIEGESMETASISETETGSAYLMTVINGETIEKVEIEITELKPQSSVEQKGICFKITDKAFLEKTNGVIQGMSGSPIVQNNKIIGAVSHVNGKDQTIGYGVYIEWMLQVSQNLKQ